ncbi:hypothetical protein ACOSQ3_010498 [Xanthoceras sorbifolium]
MINNFFLRMAVQIVEAFKSKRQTKCYTPLIGGGYLGLLSNRYLIVRIPDSRILRLLGRSLILGLFILSFPWLGSSFGGSLIDVTVNDGTTDHHDPINFEHLPLLFRDLKNEGILKHGDKALFIITNGDEDAIYDSQILSDNQMDLVAANDLDCQNAMSKDSFDFIFTHNYLANADFIERTLKPGGVAVIQASENPSSAFDKPSNYKIVYLRQFDVTVLAMRKTNNAEPNYSATHRRLLTSKEAKKAALKKLEDVLLEPPRAASRRSSKYLKRTKYLPDLMGDSLESYPRRVFIDVGLPNKEGTGWFAKNYPTRNRDFEIYKIETVTEESSGKEVPQVAEIGMSNWLRNNVKDEEYVVMKAEAEVVAEMMKSTAIRLVDELFLECKPKGNGRRMVYWECLALYGRLRDEGVAVHQWWG